VVKFSLENVLKKLDQALLELTMLQALPSVNPGQPAQWVLELEGDQAACITQALAALTSVAPTLTVLGLYPKAVAPLPQDRLAGCLSSILTAQTQLV
jgi:prephenate dehydratase